MSVYAPMLGTLWRVMESYGIDPREAIPARFYRPGGKFLFADRVSFEDYDAIQTRAASMAQSTTMGIRWGQFVHPSHFGALGYAWLASSSLRTALKRSRRFSRMFHDHLDLNLEETGDYIRADYRMNRQPTRPRLVGDGHVAGLLAMCRVNFGPDLVPREVTLKRDEPTDPTPWYEFFGPNILFGHNFNSLALDNQDADLQLTSSSPAMIRLHEEIIERYLMKRDRENILNRARLQIMEQLPSGRVTESVIASALNVSKRTLHRKLRDNGETFRSVLTQVRVDLASRYLQNADYSVTEIAFLLGYADTSAFSRAFKTWFGYSPTQAREQGKAA